MTSARSVTATFNNSGGISLADALDNTTLTWTTSGSANWFGQKVISWDGIDAAQSGLIRDNQTSTLQTTVAGPGVLSYRWKVSSEAGFDFLSFYYDGYAQAGAISGESGWLAQAWNIPSGSHVLQWQYAKDPSVSAGSDSGWVDQVVFTPGPVAASAALVSTHPLVSNSRSRQGWVKP
jgi:hypothetical protein